MSRDKRLNRTQEVVGLIPISSTTSISIQHQTPTRALNGSIGRSPRRADGIGLTVVGVFSRNVLLDRDENVGAIK